MKKTFVAGNWNLMDDGLCLGGKKVINVTFTPSASGDIDYSITSAP